MSTRTRFEKEAKGNSEMAYCFIKNALKILYKSSRLYFVRGDWMGNVQIFLNVHVNCLNLHRFALTNTDA